MSQLKVVHISTYAHGGAGTSAYRVHEALLENNIDSSFLCLDTNDKFNFKSCFQMAKPTYSLWQRVSRKILQYTTRYSIFRNIHPQNYFQYKLKKIHTLLDCEFVSLPFSNYNILEHPLVKKADIIHLHWTAGLLDYPTFFRKNTKPVIWTLHDMNSFRGIFHYEDDEVRNEDVSSALNEQVIKLKEKAIRNRKFKLQIVGPSKWILNKATQGKMFGKLEGKNIGYSLNTDVFANKINKELKQKLQIPETNIVFLFVAQNVENKRKGFQLLIEALHQLKHTNITLLVIGESIELDIPSLDIRKIGRIIEDEILRDYYSMADAFIIPSREDNLPNVMLEAMACGIPVLSFNVGGMAEVIQNGYNGLKAEKIGVNELGNILNGFIKTKDEFNANAIREFAVQHFSSKIIADKYREAYESIL